MSGVWKKRHRGQRKPPEICLFRLFWFLCDTFFNVYPSLLLYLSLYFVCLLKFDFLFTLKGLYVMSHFWNTLPSLVIAIGLFLLLPSPNIRESISTKPSKAIRLIAIPYWNYFQLESVKGPRRQADDLAFSTAFSRPSYRKLTEWRIKACNIFFRFWPPGRGRRQRGFSITEISSSCGSVYWNKYQGNVTHCVKLSECEFIVL